MGKREMSSELEVKELVANDRVRMVSDQGGTVWDTVFTVEPAGDGVTELTLVMDANAYKLAAKIFNPLIKDMIRKFIEKDLDAVKAYCEGGAS
jgi:carbon monoxide dehydrogenase subunit G